MAALEGSDKADEQAHIAAEAARREGALCGVELERGKFLKEGIAEGVALRRMME